jgi:acetyl esterase
MSLAPEIKAFLELQAAAGAPAVWEAPLSEIRANTQGRMATSGPVEPIHSILNRFIPGTTADLPIRIYRPTENPHAPAIVHFHGGGFVLNYLDMYDASMARLANQSGFTIIGVAYQKAPEHPFPIPFDDCYTTLLWVIAHAEELSIDPKAIGLAGDSAGATLASAVAIKARDNGIALKFQALIYPCNGRDFTTDSYTAMATGYGLTTKAMKWFWEQYLQGSEDDANPYAVPMSAKDLSAVAPAIIITAQYDPLLSDGEMYAAALQRDGVPVIYRQFDGMIHGFFTNMAVTPTAKVAIDYLAAELRKFAP